MDCPPLATTGFSALLDAVAARTPAPGGGAVAAALGALGAAQASMVLAYSAGKRGLEAHADEHARIGGVLEAARGQLLELGDQDAAAYAEMNALQRLDGADPARAGLPAAAERCVAIPEGVQRACLEVLSACERLGPIANAHLLSDLAIAAEAACAGVCASAWNIRVNASVLPSDRARAALADAERRLADAERLRGDIHRGCPRGE